MTAAEAQARIRARPQLNAFISLSAEEGAGPAVAVKDLVDVRGLPTTAGADEAAPAATRDAVLVARIRRGGCVVVGKTNLDPWAYGCSGENARFGDVRNPHDPARTAGGSSGGSAVAVAAGMADWAVGTDTAGSIRIPASLCGVVGFKPTFGTVDVSGVVPLAPSLDTAGALARSVDEAAGAVALMSGRPMTNGALQAPRLATLAGFADELDDETAAAWAGATAGLPEIDFPDRAGLSEICRTIQGFEASAYHASQLDLPGRYPDEIRARLRAGLEIGRGAYGRALRARARARVDAEDALDGWDAALVPATACVAPPAESAGDMREALLRCTRAFSTTGQPVIVLPVPSDGLPVGVQVVGRLGRDAELVAVARWLESRWGDPRPAPAVGSAREDG